MAMHGQLATRGAGASLLQMKREHPKATTDARRSVFGQLAASPRARAAVAASVAFLFYAVWAAWANRMHDPASIWTAAITQGAYSALVTLLMTSLVELLFRGRGRIRWRLLRCSGATIAILVVSSVAVHWIAGTAEILMTVLPSWLFGSLYAVAYGLGLAKAETGNSENHVR